MCEYYIQDKNYRVEEFDFYSDVLEKEPFLKQFAANPKNGPGDWDIEKINKFLKQDITNENEVLVINKILEEGWKTSLKEKISKILSPL